MNSSINQQTVKKRSVENIIMVDEGFFDIRAEIHRHDCSLRKGSTSCLPRLTPQAGKLRRFFRSFRKFLLISDKNPATFQVFRSSAAVTHESRRHIASRNWFVIHPFSQLSMYVETIMAITWLIVFFKDPVSIVFMPAYRTIDSLSYNLLVIVTDSILSLFCLSRFFTGKLAIDVVSLVILNSL